jgi:hypothetical protein
MTTFYSDEIDSSANTERSTTSVIHRYSTSGAGAAASIGATLSLRCKETLTGALTAGVLSSALINLSGTAGALHDCALYTNDATARTLRIQIVADGITVFDSTTASVAASGSGFWAVANGQISSSVVLVIPPIVFNSTLTVKVASSVTETDKTSLAYIYVTRA